MLMVGPPGAGKSMLAARLPGLLPPLDPSEALEVSMIHSLSGVHVLRPPEDNTTPTHRRAPGGRGLVLSNVYLQRVPIAPLAWLLTH